MVVGLLVASIGLSLGGPTGFAINPARDLGPRIAHAILPISGKGGSDWSYALVPIVGLSFAKFAPWQKCRYPLASTQRLNAMIR